jgi:glycosyltransferase involved in cell wall biosynthesis
MKVALLSSSYHPYYKGGGEHSVKDLAEKLTTKGIETTVITAFRHAEREKIDGVSVIRVPHPNIYWSFESQRQPFYKKLVWHSLEGYNRRVKPILLPILNEINPDVLHIRNTEDFSPYAVKVAKSSQIPVVVTLNSCTWLCPRGTMFKNNRNCDMQCISCKLITYPKKVLSKYVDAVVGVSQFTLNRHIEYGYFNNSFQHVVYTSTVPQPLPFPLEYKPQLSFGFIGRVHPTKGVAELIKAFCTAGPGNKLFIAGDGPDEYYSYCRELAKSRDNIIFLGKTEPKEFYSLIDIAIINSLFHDPFPRVLVEAYAFGRPVIASNTGGTPEMVVHEETGWVFDPFSPGQLEDKIQRTSRLSVVELQKLQEHTQRFIKNKLHGDVDQYLGIYEKILSI